MYPDIRDRDHDSTAIAAIELLKELVWVLPLGFCAAGYYLFELRGWNLALFVALCIVGSLCLAVYSVAEYRERRARSSGAKRASSDRGS